MSIIIILALVFGGGTSIVANGSLPGDALYNVKTNVNEKVGGLFTFSTEAKANFDAELVGKRLEELEQLTVSGHLNAENRAKAEAVLEKNLSSFKANADTLEKNKENSKAVSVKSNLEATLKAHQRLFLSLKSENPEANQEVGSVIVKLNSNLNLITSERMRSEGRLSAEANTDQEGSAQGKMKAAQNKIDEVMKVEARLKASLSADVLASAEAKLQLANQAMVDGKAELEAKAYNEAFLKFQAAMNFAQEAKVTFETGSRLEVGLGLIKAKIKAKVEGEPEVDNRVSDEGRNDKAEDKSNSYNANYLNVDSNTDVKVETKPLDVNGNVKVKLGL